MISPRRFVVLSLILTFAVIAAPLSSLHAASPVQTALTNQDISDMHRAGLSADIIVAKIKSGPCNFDTSPAALQHLKTDKVPDNVILTMVNAEPSGKPSGAGKPDANASANGDVVHLHAYRQHRGINSTFAPSIFVDDKQIARVSNGSRFTIKLSPGAHSIRSDDNSSAISLDAKPGQEYFIRVDEVMGMPKSHGKLTMMSPEQDGPEYKLQKPLEDKHKIARDMIEGDGPDES
jgi:hypothetical protein